MFLPLKDINPTHRRPVATYTLIAANVAVFIYQISLGSRLGSAFVASYGATPFEITHMTDLVGQVKAGLPLLHFPGTHPIFLTLLTSMFIHGGFAHLGGNMLFLWIFGNNVEDLLGPVRFVLFYLLCGLAAHALHIASNPSSMVPTVGASGAISGVLGAYLVAFPRARVLTLVFLGFFIRMAVLPAFVIIIYWFVIQFVLALASLGGTGEGGVAWFAHVGGFLAGIALIFAMAGSRLFRLRRVSLD
ncbi:MAG: rhomboid family intramembrane serine protease [Candidatus Krumholzibacteria bacterium]|nr:rhomboid family intramembrane serine protease [Candidatus Krumholzibacteria bacterium]